MSQVSVIVPCYQYGHFLRACVESVLAQAGVDVRVLILDDASTDNTPEVAAELIDHDPRVEYRRHAHNAGHIATYNEGHAWTNGDYTVLLSADDLLTPGALLRATRLMDTHPDVGFVYGDHIVISPEQPRPQPRLPPTECTWQIWPGGVWLKSICHTGRNPIRSPEVVVRTELLKELGGFRPELPHTNDFEMWMRLAAHAAVGKILDADQAFYRIHTQNMHVQDYGSRLQDLRECARAFDTFFAGHGNRIRDHEKLRKLAYRSLACRARWDVCQAYDCGEALGSSIAELLDFAMIADTCGEHDIHYWQARLSLRLRMFLGPQLSPLLRPLGAWIYQRH